MQAPIRFDLASPVFKADPYPTHARLREAAPVYRATLGFRRTARVTQALRRLHSIVQAAAS
jgi:hypothetical protein